MVHLSRLVPFYFLSPSSIGHNPLLAMSATISHQSRCMPSISLTLRFFSCCSFEFRNDFVVNCLWLSCLTNTNYVYAIPLKYPQIKVLLYDGWHSCLPLSLSNIVFRIYSFILTQYYAINWQKAKVKIIYWPVCHGVVSSAQSRDCFLMFSYLIREEHTIHLNSL